MTLAHRTSGGGETSLGASSIVSARARALFGFIRSIKTVWVVVTSKVERDTLTRVAEELVLLASIFFIIRRFRSTVCLITAIIAVIGVVTHPRHRDTPVT